MPICPHHDEDTSRRCSGTCAAPAPQNLHAERSRPTRFGVATREMSQTSQRSARSWPRTSCRIFPTRLVETRNSFRWLVHRLPTSCRRYSSFASAPPLSRLTSRRADPQCCCNNQGSSPRGAAPEDSHPADLGWAASQTTLLNAPEALAICESEVPRAARSSFAGGAVTVISNQARKAAALSSATPAVHKMRSSSQTSIFTQGF